MRRSRRQLVIEHVDHRPDLRPDPVRGFLVEDRLEHGAHPLPLRLRHHLRQVLGVVGTASLPGGVGEHVTDGVLDPAVRITGDQPDDVRAPGLQIAEEPVPRRRGLGSGDQHAENLPVPFGVDAGRQQDRGFDHPAAFANLDRQRVGRQVQVRAGIQRSGTEVGDQGVEVLGQRRHVALGHTGDAEGFHQIIHPAGGHAFQVGGGHGTGQGGFNAGAVFQRPVGKQEPCRSFGTATSTVPTRVSRSR